MTLGRSAERSAGNAMRNSWWSSGLSDQPSASCVAGLFFSRYMLSEQAISVRVPVSAGGSVSGPVSRRRFRDVVSAAERGHLLTRGAFPEIRDKGSASRYVCVY